MALPGHKSTGQQLSATEFNSIIDEISNKLGTGDDLSAFQYNLLDTHIANSGGVSNSDKFSQDVYPEMYNAVGDGVTDDTIAIQAMFTDAIANHKRILIPNPANFYKITSTIQVIAAPNTDNFRLDLVAHGNTQFMYYGAANTAMFHVSGLRFSQWEGLRVGLGNNNAGVILFDIDTDGASGSTSDINFTNIHAGLTAGLNQLAWRIGKNSANGGDLSILKWDNCSVYGLTGAAVKGQTAWKIVGGNTLQLTWINTFAAFLDRMYSNDGGGNGSVYFFGVGASHNNLDFEISNAQTYLISGGRFEVGKHLLHVNSSNVCPAITFETCQIDSYDPSEPSEPYSNGSLIFMDMPASLKLSNCNITGAVYDENMIKGYGGGGSTAFGKLLISGGTISCAQKDMFYSLQKNDTRWGAWVQGVSRIQDLQPVEFMTDKAGLIPSGQLR